MGPMTSDSTPKGLLQHLSIYVRHSLIKWRMFGKTVPMKAGLQCRFRFFLLCIVDFN